MLLVEVMCCCAILNEMCRYGMHRDREEVAVPDAGQ